MVKLVSKLSRLVCAAMAAVAVGCANSETLLQPNGQTPGGGWLSPQAKTGRGLVYVSDLNGSAVYIYDKHGLSRGPIGKITSGINAPNGLAVGRRGDLYVANSDSTISVYHPGQTTPSRIYTNGVSLPIGVVVSARTGRLYVANFDSYSITEYPKGSTSPDVTISFQHLEGNDPFAVALDGQDNLFVAALGYPTARAYEVPFGSDTPKDLGISGIRVMHGIAVDGKGNVIVVDQGGDAIDIYPPGSNSPKKKIIAGLIQPQLVALGRLERSLYVADSGLNGYDGGLWVYSYPRGKLLMQIHLPGRTIPEGVAVTPI